MIGLSFGVGLVNMRHISFKVRGQLDNVNRTEMNKRQHVQMNICPREVISITQGLSLIHI